MSTVSLRFGASAGGGEPWCPCCRGARAAAGGIGPAIGAGRPPGGGTDIGAGSAPCGPACPDIGAG